MMNFPPQNPLKTGGLLALLLIACAPTKPAINAVPERPVRIIKGDTLVYQVAFADSNERLRFGDAFSLFLKEQRFLVERYDSAGVYSFFKILTEKTAHGAATFPAAMETRIPAAPESATPSADTALPPSGGSLRLYYPRGSIEYPFTALVEASPFGEKNGNDSLPGYFTVANSSASAVTLRLAGKIADGSGAQMTVLDIITAWTRFIKEHPAEGLGLFRSCDGIMEYLNGQETVVRGITAVDNNTVRIRLAAADPQAVERLRGPRTLPAPFKLGKYVITARRGNDLVLSANRARPEVPHVNKCTVRCGGDANPLLSFSLGRYDAVVLSGAADIDYARRNLLKNGTCSLVGRDRYFIACALQDSAARAFVRAAVSGPDLLRNFVKAEGAPIAAVESDSAAAPDCSPAPSGERPQQVQSPITILFRKDDAASKVVAERLLAAITHAGVPAALAAADERAYEDALAGRNYGCAVGWVPETVLFDTCEKLRLAAVFFKDDQDETKRVRENREIPLFSLDWYLLAKSNVGLYKGAVRGLYVKQENRQ